ncbi:MAG: DUF5110 domain-containing protein, partial [Gillisia sp.]
EYTTNAITLLVNPDKNGKATGILYDDDGDGYGYKSGDYSVETFTITTEGKQLKLMVSHTDGNRKVDRKYRIGLVKDGKISYSDWSSDKVQFLTINK